MGFYRFIIARILKKIRIPAIKSSQLDDTSRVCSGSSVISSTLGRYSYIGNDCSILFVDIGPFCSIADNVIIGGASHPIDRVSSSPVFHSGKNILRKNFSKADFQPFSRTSIGSDVWIGSGAMIKGGVAIGHGAVIGMGAVVTKNIGPYEIWGGNPAKLIRKRFDDDMINQLLNSNWWDLDDHSISNIAKHFKDPEHFINKAK